MPLQKHQFSLLERAANAICDGRPSTLRAIMTSTESSATADAERIGELINSLEPDIEEGMSSEIGDRSAKAATELSKIGEPAVEPLIRALPRTSWAHYALSLIGGDAAFQALCGELRTGDWMRVEAAARGLGRMRDPRALEFLRPHVSTTSAEVYGAVTEAIANIERAQIGERDWLRLDREDPVGQAKRVWPQFDKIREDSELRERAIQWHREFVAAMPELKFRSDQERGDVWGMLGTLIYYFLNPDRSDIYGGCPEAEHCYEQCLKYTPDRHDIKFNLQALRRGK